MTKTFIDRVHDEISWLQNSDNQKLLQNKFNELKKNSNQNQNQNQNFSVSIFLLLPDDKKLIFRTLSSESGFYLLSNNAKNKAAGRKASELEKIMRQTVSDVSQIESTLSRLEEADHSEKLKPEQIADQSSELYQPQKKSANLTDIKSILDGYHQQKGKFRQFFSFFHPWIAIAGRSAEIYLLEKALTRLSEDMQDWQLRLASFAGELKTRREKNANESCFSCCGVFARKNNKKSKKTQTDLVLDTIIDDLSPIQSW